MIAVQSRCLVMGDGASAKANAARTGIQGRGNVSSPRAPHHPHPHLHLVSRCAAVKHVLVCVLNISITSIWNGLF